MINSKYVPTSNQEYSAKDLNTDFQGATFNITPNTTTDCDFLISDDSILDGLVVDILNENLGDKMSFQIIDKDNVMGYGQDVVLKQFATDIYVTPGIIRQIDHTSSYPAKAFSGLYLRLKYTSTHSETGPILIIRYKLHKILW